MITNSELINTSIKALVSAANNPADYYSLTKILADINNVNPKLLPIIEENIDQLTSECLTEQVNLAIQIGVVNPKERAFVIAAIADLEPSPASNALQTVSQLNQKLISQNVKYKISTALANELPQLIQKSRAIRKCLVNLQLIGKRKLTEDIFPYSERYFSQPVESLSSTISRLKKALDDMTKNSTNPQAMVKIGINALSQLGYLNIAIEGKDPGQLANTIVYEMVAAEGVNSAKQKAGQENITSNQVKDQIAIYLIKTLSR